MINNPEAACYFCGLRIGKEAEELAARLSLSGSDEGIDFEVLKTVGDYFTPALYICRSGDDEVAHENCLQWGESVWQPSPQTLAGVDTLIDNCQAYACDLCSGTRASVKCTGRHCRTHEEDAGTYHFPCILMLFLNRLADMDTKVGDLLIQCVDCFVDPKKKKRCRFVDDNGAEEGTTRKAKRMAEPPQDDVAMGL